MIDRRILRHGESPSAPPQSSEEWLKTRIRKREAELERCLNEIHRHFENGLEFRVTIRRRGISDLVFGFRDGPGQ